jgi:hypothetical protein
MGTKLRDLIGNLDHLLNILVITDDDVEAQNRVTPSALFTDEHGPVSKVEIHHRQRSRRTLENRAFLVQRAVELLRAAGAREVHHLDWPPLILHTQSSMRMGADPADSVVDPNAESRAVKRLFVADTAALSNGAGGANPTLTTQALATRTAERILQLYFGGEPFVGREAPVSSVDDVVTRAVLGVGPATSAPAPAQPVVSADQRGLLPATGGSDHRLLGALALGGGVAAGMAARRMGAAHRAPEPDGDTPDPGS